MLREALASIDDIAVRGQEQVVPGKHFREPVERECVVDASGSRRIREMTRNVLGQSECPAVLDELLPDRGKQIAPATAIEYNADRMSADELLQCCNLRDRQA